MNIDEDKHDRQKRVMGWNQDKLMAANVAVVGAGALGNEVVKNLLQLGVGKLTIIDYDSIVKANLNRCVLFMESDAEKNRLKAEVLAERGKTISKTAEITPIIKNVEELNDTFFAKFDAVFGCLDNLGARLHVNANAYNHAPFIDGGTTGFLGKVQVVSSPSACVECALSKQDYGILWRKYSCVGEMLDVMDPKMPALPTTTSIVSAVQVNEFLKIIHGNSFKSQTLVGKYWTVNGLTGESKIFEITKRNNCPAHE